MIRIKMNKINTLPTGYLFTIDGERGELEVLSIGDYGKKANVKADFLGYTEHIKGVINQPCMPLSEKWVVTLSTQYGCPQKCNFCQVPEIPFKGNVSFLDLKNQLYNALSLFPDVSYTERLNIHFARMGEPIYNPAVIDFAIWLQKEKRTFQKETGISFEVIHPVLTTSLPRRFKRLKESLLRWIDVKNNIYNGQAGLQISINSSNEDQRQEMFGGESITLEEFSTIAKDFEPPLARKYCLNIAYASGNEIDGKKLATLFNPDYWMCKITPIHNNDICRKNGIETIDGYSSYEPYLYPETELKAAGFDVLVFIPSMDEEQGLVTCGNLIIGGSTIGKLSGGINIDGIKIVKSEL